jgi:hypothetical protein
LPTLGTYEVELKDGYVVSARDAVGTTWASDLDGPASPEVMDMVQDLRQELGIGPAPVQPEIAESDRQAKAPRLPMRQSSLSRAITHLAVLGAALVPMSFTVASAQTNPVAQQRLTIPFSLDAAMTRDSFAMSPLRAAAAADAQSPTLPAAAIADGTPPPAAPPPPPSPRPLAGSGGHFPWGYCTWYVSTKRFVPWMGNAIDWWPNARPFGVAEGMTPKVGAIMVTRESWVGHVAYVEAVDSSGGFTISEMNYKGFGIVDQRHFSGNPSYLVGFIY